MGGVCSSKAAPEDTEAVAPSRTAPISAASESGFTRNGRVSRQNSLSRQTSAVRRKVFAGSRLNGDDPNVPRKSIKTEEDRSLVRAALQEGTLLGALNTDELEDMIDFMELVTITPGKGNELDGCLCVVMDGELKLRYTPNTISDSEEKTCEVYRAGQVFGQVGLVRDRNVGGSLHASVDGGVARICKLQGSSYRKGMEFSRQAQIKANMKLLSSIPIFHKLSMHEQLHISDASEVRGFKVNEQIIREGEPGQMFFILRNGGAAVTRQSKGIPHRIDYKYPGDYFGEAALLDDAPRNATVTAAEEGTEAICVSKALFNEQLLGPLKEIMGRGEKTIQQQMLVTVPLLAQLTAEKRSLLTDRLRLETFYDGDYIFKEGDDGDRLFIIKTGEVSVISQGKVSASRTLDGQPREIDHLFKGQYFGERALLKSEPRMAGTRAVGKLECYSLAKDDFDSLRISSEIDWRRRWDREDTRDVSQLKVIKPMGSGAFGTAWLVVHTQTERAYALKSLDKHTIKRQNWTSVVMREKDVLASLSPHPNVITLYNAFQSPTQLFMLMDLASGGELFQLLEKNRRFQPLHARFFCGCVVLAIGHLHKHGVVFRDLKPENLLLTSTGYLKLIDMGFAKRVGKGEKTYTLCGTPYYLAPEMILHRGHGLALDWWTVGVLTYEMIEGEPPFMGTSEMEVYGKVTRMQWSTGPRFSSDAASLVHSLLKKEPESRLGNLRNGVDDVMAHPWFHDFSWDDLYDGTIPAPFVPSSNSLDQQGEVRNRHGKKSLDLTEVITDTREAGYWPGW